MHIRTFRAPSLQDALVQIREQMGPEAAILHTRQVGRGLLGRRQMEVTAGLRVDVPSRLATLPAATHRPETARPAETTRPAEASVPPAGEPPREREEREGLIQRIDRLSQLVEQMRTDRRSAARPPLGQAATEVLAELASVGFDEATARKLVDQAQAGGSSNERPSGGELRRRVVREIGQRIRVAGPIRIAEGRRRTVAMVGPTGVGKTTTIAKLAAGFRLREQLRVGLITIDTFRIAAVEQLKAYAEIMDLPMQVVERADQMRGALERLGEVDVVLIDSAGRSPRDDAQVGTLARLLDAAEPDEVHLVLSATSGPAAAARAARGFAAVRPSRLVLTKLDEIDSPAAVLPSLGPASPPLSYLTNGQQVPDDIEPAISEKLIASMFGPLSV